MEDSKVFSTILPLIHILWHRYPYSFNCALEEIAQFDFSTATALMFGECVYCKSLKYIHELTNENEEFLRFSTKEKIVNLRLQITALSTYSLWTRK